MSTKVAPGTIHISNPPSPPLGSMLLPATSATIETTKRKVIDSLKADPFFRNETSLKQDVCNLEPDVLQQALDAFMEEIGKEESCRDLPEIARRLAEVIPLEKLEAAARQKCHNYSSAVEAASTMLARAEYYLKVTEPKTVPWHAALTGVIETLIMLLESIVNAFGIADFFKPAESAFHSDMKFQKIMMLLSCFTVLGGILFPLIGAELGAIIVGGTLALIALLSLIYPLLRPTPSKLPGDSINLTKLAREGELSTIGGRVEGANQIAQRLIDRQKKVRTSPIILGDTGVGKNQTLKLFVQRLEEGHYPELKGLTVFYYNAADLVNSYEMFGGGNRILSRISEEMGSNRDKIVIVIDEAHEMCIKRENSDIAGQLKTRLDDGGGFTVVCMTTKQEYEKHMLTNAALSDRFKPVTITSMDKEDSFEVMRQFVLEKAQTTLVDESALEDLWNAVNQVDRNHLLQDSQQPGSVLRILTGCVQRTMETQKSPAEVELEQQQEKLRRIRMQGVLGEETGSLFSPERTRQIAELEKRVADLEQQIKNEEHQRKLLFQKRELLAQVKRTMHQQVVEASRFPKNLSDSNKAGLGAVLVMDQFLIPALGNLVRARAKELHVKAVIDRELVREVVEAENANKARR